MKTLPSDMVNLTHTTFPGFSSEVLHYLHSPKEQGKPTALLS